MSFSGITYMYIGKLCTLKLRCTKLQEKEKELKQELNLVNESKVGQEKIQNEINKISDKIKEVEEEIDYSKHALKRLSIERKDGDIRYEQYIKRIAQVCLEYEKNRSYNDSWIERLEKENKDSIICTPQNLSFVFSMYIGRELKILNEVTEIIDRNNFKIYFNRCLRALVDEVIKYIYMIKEPNRMEEYFGAKMKDINLGANNMMKQLKKIGEYRYTKPLSTKNMAREIGEFDNANPFSLYSIFSYCSEYVHDGYFHAYLDSIGEYEGYLYSLEYEVNALETILDKFHEIYRKFID